MGCIYSSTTLPTYFPALQMAVEGAYAPDLNGDQVPEQLEAMDLYFEWNGISSFCRNFYALNRAAPHAILTNLAKEKKFQGQMRLPGLFRLNAVSMHGASHSLSFGWLIHPDKLPQYQVKDLLQSPLAGAIRIPLQDAKGHTAVVHMGTPMTLQYRRARYMPEAFRNYGTGTGKRIVQVQVINIGELYYEKNARHEWQLARDRLRVTVVPVGYDAQAPLNTIFNTVWLYPNATSEYTVTVGEVTLTGQPPKKSK